MFDLLTYQKGGSVLRMLERWLGADAFRAGVRALPRPLPAREHRDDRPLGLARSRRPSQPVRRIMDSWIFQPGLPDRHRDRRRRPGDDHAAALPLRRRRRATTRWAIPVRARVHSGTRRRRDRCCSTATSTTFDVPAGRARRAQRRRRGLLPRRVPAGVARPPARRGRARTARTVLARRRPLGVGARRPRDRRGAARARAPAPRRDRPRRVARARERAARHGARSSRATRSPHSGPRSPTCSAPTARAARLAGRRAATTRARGNCAGWCSTRSGTLVRGPGDDRVGARAVRDAGSGDPDVASAASIAIVASAGDADDVRRVRRAGRATADVAAGAAALPLRARRRSRPRSSRCARPSYALSDAVRPQNGPFVIQRALRNREHGPAVWAFVRDHWDDVRGRFSGSLIPRLIDGTTWLVDDASIADVPRFLAEHPVPEGARVIAQHLERQRVHRGARRPRTRPPLGKHCSGVSPRAVARTRRSEHHAFPPTSAFVCGGYSDLREGRCRVPMRSETRNGRRGPGSRRAGRSGTR